MPAISRPLLILMAATVALMAFLVIGMRPKPVAVKDTPLAATEQISKAKDAAATSDAANAKLRAATGGVPAATAPAQSTATPATPTSAAATKPAPAASAPSSSSAGERRDAALVRDLKRGKIAVLLFWNPQAADDIAARGALRDIDLHGGKVVVRVVPITRVAQYASVTSGVKIAQSPTTVIIGRKGKTRAIIGFTEQREIDQAVDDALAGR